MPRSLSLTAYRALTRRRQGKAGAADAAPPPRPVGEVIWAHATTPQRHLAVLDVARRLETLRPDAAVLVTYNADSSTAAEIAAIADSSVTMQPLAGDHPGEAARFLDHWRPDLCLWTGGRLWINHVSAAAERGIPMILADADQTHLASRKHKWFPELTRQALGKRGLAHASVITEWERIIGPDLARYSQPEKLIFPRGQRDRGTLHIRVLGSLATELQHLEPLVIERVNTHFGYRAVERIRLIQAPLRREDRQAKQPKPLPAADKQELTELRQSLDHVENPEMRAVLERIGESILRRKKATIEGQKPVKKQS